MNSTPPRPVCPAHLRQTSLADCEIYYREGRFPYADLVAYLRAWNATPGRFTQAVWRDGAIRQYDPETAGACYRLEAAEFGAATS